MQTPEPLHVVPYDAQGKEIAIMQGWDGPWSHKDAFPYPNSSLRFAVDFALEYGTVVHAARAGIVRILLMRSDAYFDGPDPNPDPKILRTRPPNVAMIEAADGTFDMYVHLEKQSAMIKEGDAISEHQPIAKTGRSGWVGTVPHLHFHSQKGKFGEPIVTIPIAFRDYLQSLWHEDLKKP